MIEIMLETDTVMTGHFLAAEIRWSAAEPHPVRRIVVAAEWKAVAFNGTKHGVGRATAHVPVRGEREGTFPVQLLIPHEGPVTFRGEVLTIEWNLWARIDRPGPDEFSHLGFRVVPRRVT